MKFIMLTDFDTGATSYFNANHIVSFKRDANSKFTSVSFRSSAVFYVKETPDEIMKELK